MPTSPQEPRDPGRPRPGSHARPGRLWNQLALPVAGTAGVTAVGLSAHAEGFRAGFLFLYIPVVAWIGYTGGRTIGVLAALLSTLGGWYFLLGSPGASFAAPGDAAAVFGLFAASALATGLGFGYAREADQRRQKLEDAQRHLAAIVASSDDAIFSKTLDAVILTWNAGAERLYGYTPAEVIGRPVSMLAPPEQRDEIPAIMARLLRGEVISHHETVRMKKDGTRFDVSLTISPVRDAAGRIIGASTVARDVSDRTRVERRLRLLARATEILTPSLDLPTTLQALAQAMVPGLADWCAVDLARDDGGRDRVAAAPTEGPGHTPRSSAAATAASTIEVPLTVRGRALGTMTFGWLRPGRRCEGDDLALAEEVARRAALVIENAHLHERESAAGEAARRAAERATRLQRATAALSGAVSEREVVRAIVQEGIAALGARAAFVVVVSDDGHALELMEQVGYPGDFAQSLRRIALNDRHPLTEAAQSGRPLFFESDADLWSRYPGSPTAFADVARAMIPLTAADRRLGVLGFSFPAPRTFGEQDRAVMITLAQQCSQALERAKLYERERHVARMLQQAFLPEALPEIPGLAIDAVYAPAASEAQVGGDWYDVFYLPDGRVACIVGDVVGSGLEAGVVMGQVRQSIRAAALEDSRPEAVLDRASRVLRLTYGLSSMATALVGVLDPLESTFTYAAAGHPAPLLAVPGAEPEMLRAGGLPLGMEADKPRRAATASLPPGGLLVLYTDGLIESTRDVREGEARLRRAIGEELANASLSPAGALLHRVVGAEPAKDDIAIVTISVAPSPIREIALRLPADRSSGMRVRQAIGRLARTAGWDPYTAFNIQVVVGEALNNVVEHAYGPSGGTVWLRLWSEEDVVRIEVRDAGQWRELREPDGGGRGLGIMQALAETVRIERSPAGTTVRLSVRVPGAGTGVGEAPAAQAVPMVPAGEEDLPLRPEIVSLPGARLELASVDGVPVLGVQGDVDGEAVGPVVALLERAAKARSSGVVISLADVSFFDSHAIRALMRYGERLAVYRKRLLLVCPPDAPAHRLLAAAQVAEAFPVLTSVAEAVAVTRPKQTRTR